MTHKYEKNCWYCGSSDLEPDSRGVVCKRCGATWNEIGKSDSLAVAGPARVIRGEGGLKIGKAALPSKRSLREAAKARGELPAKRQRKQ